MRCIVMPLALVASMAVASACSTSSPAPTPSATAAKSADLIAIAPITISFRGTPIARMFPDGRTESAGPKAPGTGLLPGPTFRADGTIILTGGGIATLDAKGDLYAPSAPGTKGQLFGNITGDRFVFATSGRAWDVRVQDNLIQFGETNSSQIEGTVTPAVRHTALVMAAAFYLEGAVAAGTGMSAERAGAP